MASPLGLQRPAGIAEAYDIYTSPLRPTPVCRLERVGNLCSNRQRFGNRQARPRAPWAGRKAVGERRPFDQLHHQRAYGISRTLLKAVDVRDVGVIERGQHFRLALEPREAIRVGRQHRGQHFDGHVALQLRVGRAIDLAHAACANSRDDLIGAKASSGNERHAATSLPSASSA